jgi:DNA polymerase lambda
MQFNRSLRLYARKMGYSLNQRGLYKGVIRGKDGLKVTEGGSTLVTG